MEIYYRLFGFRVELENIPYFRFIYLLFLFAFFPLLYRVRIYKSDIL